MYCVHEGGGEHVVESCGAGTGSLGGGRGWDGGRGAVVYCGGRRHSVSEEYQRSIDSPVDIDDATMFCSRAVFTRLRTRGKVR